MQRVYMPRCWHQGEIQGGLCERRWGAALCQTQSVPAGHSQFQLVTAGSSQLYNSPTTKSESISNAGGISRETQFKRKKCCTSMWSGGKQGVRNSPAPGQSRRTGRRCSRHQSRDCWAAHGDAHTGAGEKCEEEGTAERNCDGLNTSPYSPSFPVILRAGEEARVRSEGLNFSLGSC